MVFVEDSANVGALGSASADVSGASSRKTGGVSIAALTEGFRLWTANSLVSSSSAANGEGHLPRLQHHRLLVRPVVQALVQGSQSQRCWNGERKFSGSHFFFGGGGPALVVTAVGSGTAQTSAGEKRLGISTSWALQEAWIRRTPRQREWSINALHQW
jgi:hypothetical protein